MTLELIAPESVAPGDDVRLKALVASNKVGHDFPTGPLDIIQSWVAVEVVDGAGKKVFSSGEVDPNGFVQEGAFMFKAEGVDKAGNLIDRHNLWEMVGARFRRSLFPGFTDSADFEFACPSALARVAPLQPETEAAFKAPTDGDGALRVSARVRYRKVDQALLNFVSPNKRLEAPITDMAHATATIRVVPRGE